MPLLRASVGSEDLGDANKVTKLSMTERRRWKAVLVEDGCKKEWSRGGGEQGEVSPRSRAASQALVPVRSCS